ncbi:MAG TPA: DUF4340 domain-containing protein [Opitutaceae bacterium]|nr:DUF4340 domain-containing protein [Opitutaceae bacterium]
MRTKVTLVLLFLNVALFFFIFKFDRDWKTPLRELEARRRVLGAETADIRTIEVATSTPGRAFSLEKRRGDQWVMTAPIEWPANPHAVSTIVHDLQLLENETKFPTKDLGKNGHPTLADYGLDKPKLTVTFRSGPETSRTSTTLRIGDTTKVGNRLYILSPDGDWVHVVNRSLADNLSLPLEQLRAETLLTIPVYEAASLSIRTGSPDQARSGTAGGPPIRIRRLRDVSRWQFETPMVARASKLMIDTTINDLNRLHVKSFPPPPPVAPSAAHNLRVSLEGNNRQETLFLGEPVPAPAGATATPKPGAPADVEFYAQLEGRPPVFTVVVPASLVDLLRNSTVLLREKRFLDFEPRTVNAITLEAPLTNQPALTLQRLENATDATTGGWQIVRRNEGAPGTQTQPADAALVQRLLNQLMSLTAIDFVSDAPTSAQSEAWGFNRAERIVRLTFGGSAAPGAAPTELVLRLGTDAQRQVYARAGTPSDPGTSIYSVDAEILRELPADPVAWRQRLVHELPATARISALKLIDLTRAEKPLVEATFDAAGQPASAGANPEALKKLAMQMRKLTARRFVQGSFSDKVTIGGDERPWRYRLEATVSLPGGAGEQSSTLPLMFTERVGGAQQFAGSRELDAIFELDQPMIDALWPLTEGARDPGAPAETKP